MGLREAPIAAADLDPVPVAGCALRCARCAMQRAKHAPTRCASCAIPGAARTSTECARRCARCASQRAGPALHTVCNLCHSGCGRDCRGIRPTVYKVCNSARRTRPPYGVQVVPFRVQPGPPRDAPHGVQGVQCSAPVPPPYGVQAVPFRVRLGPPQDAPHGVQGVPFDAPSTPPYGVQAVPFRVRPGPPRDAPHGVQGVPFDAPRNRRARRS